MSRARPRRCIICLKGPDLKQVCPTCKKAPYCSLECRQTDAPIHELLCASTDSFLHPKKADSTRAIIFPSMESKPRFVWIEPNMDLSPEMRPVQHLHQLLGNDTQKFPRMKIQPLIRNDMRNVDLLEADRIAMCWRENYEDEFQLNKAIKAVVDECKKSDIASEVISAWLRAEKEKAKESKAKIENASQGIDKIPGNDNQVVLQSKSPREPKEPKPPKQIFPRGNVIFVAHNPAGALRSVNHTDFRNIVDYLRLYRNPKSGQKSSREFRSRLIEGIRINGLGDVTEHDLPRFQTIHFPQDHPIFQQPDADPYAVPQAILGIGRFKLMGVPPSTFPREEISEKHLLENPTISKMMVHLEPGSKNWGMIDIKYGIPQGSVQVVRADRKHLKLEEVKALLWWLKKREKTSIFNLRGSSLTRHQQKSLDEMRRDWREECRAAMKARKSKQEEHKSDAVGKATTSKEAEQEQQKAGAMDVIATSKKADERENSKLHGSADKSPVLDATPGNTDISSGRAFVATPSPKPKVPTLSSKSHIPTPPSETKGPALLSKQGSFLHRVTERAMSVLSSNKPDIPAPLYKSEAPALPFKQEVPFPSYEPEAATLPPVQEVPALPSEPEVLAPTYESDIQTPFHKSKAPALSSEQEVPTLSFVSEVPVKSYEPNTPTTSYEPELSALSALSAPAYIPETSGEDADVDMDRWYETYQDQEDIDMSYLPGLDTEDFFNSTQPSDIDMMFQELEEQRAMKQ